jgi:hypothetical protein
MPTSQQLGMTPAVVTFSGNLANIPINLAQVVSAGQYSKFPAPWQPLSGDPSIRVVVTNNSVSAPIAPMLVDQYVDSGIASGPTLYSIFTELRTVQPGQTVDELVKGIPVSQMLLCLYYLGISTAEISTGFTVGVKTYRL